MFAKNISGAVFFFSLLFCLAAEASQQIITLHYPPDMTVMKFNLLGVSLSVSQGSADLIEISVVSKRFLGVSVGVSQGSADLIEIGVTSKKVVNIIPGRDFQCFSVPLQLGINRVDITAKREGAIVDDVALTVFRSSDLISRYKHPPDDFQKDYFHVQDRSRCASCHVMEPAASNKRPMKKEAFAADVSGANAVTPSESGCYSCHRGMISDSFVVHGPASAWSCLNCHNPRAEPKYYVSNTVADVCFSCHVEEKRRWGNKLYYHGPFATDKCIICHNPHASQNPFRLSEPIWLLCISCHTAGHSGEHTVARYFGGRRHPTHGVPDPSRKGRELSCTSCHNPHTSGSRQFTKLDATSGIVSCRKCHFRISGKR